MAINAVSTTLLSSFLGGVSGGESDTGAGLVFGEQTSSVDLSRVLNYADNTSNTYSSIVYSPANYTYSIPVITISGSQVRDTGNTQTTMPSSTTLSQTPSTTQGADQSGNSGKDSSSLSSVIVPIAAIAGVGLLGFGAISLIGGKKNGSKH